MLPIYKSVLKKFPITKKTFDFICGNEDFSVHGFRWEASMSIHIKSPNVTAPIPQECLNSP